MLKEGLVEKSDQFYQLTPQGLEIASRLDTSLLEVTKQPKVSVLVFVSRKVGTKPEILLVERLTDPIKSFVSCPTSKVRFGELFEEAAERCLLEETGLTATVEYTGLIRYVDRMNDSIREDAVIACFRAIKLNGTILSKSKKTKNFWMQVAQAKKLQNVYPDFSTLLDHLLDNRQFYLQSVVNYT
ncbi:NUDIX domain-containing protein [Candidatus Microgenomates bacterium]|nr:NUDIX domain-containing protein [Candidatus Microgenomates bacterium]